MKIASVGLNNSFKANESCVKNPGNCQNGQCTHKPHGGFNITTASGWTAVGALAVALISGAAHKNKLHKVSAVVSALAGAVHVGSVTGHHNHHKNFVA